MFFYRVDPRNPDKLVNLLGYLRVKRPPCGVIRTKDGATFVWSSPVNIPLAFRHVPGIEKAIPSMRFYRRFKAESFYDVNRGWEDAITFGHQSRYYAWLKLDYPAPIKIGGKEWPTAEHYVLAQGAKDRKVSEAIRRAKTIREARKLARRAKAQWTEQAVLKALRAKFKQHRGLAKKLLATKGEPIAYLAQWGRNADRYWGVGYDRHGKNRLGKLIMKVRKELRKARRYYRRKKIVA